MRLLKACIINSILVCFLSTQAMGQGPGGPGDPGCDPLDPYCPIDGGLSLLIAAGIGIGAKRVHDARKKTKEINSIL